MSKQDRQGVRTPAEIEQKYGLGQFMYNQNQKNQDLSKEISNLGDSFSAYKTENEERLTSMSDSFNESIKDVEKGLSEDITSLSKDINALSKDIFNMIYPVGHIYFSASATNPSTLFGGTWERIEDTFLLAAGSSYAAGATGGEATHTLTVNEMPSHSHNIKTIEKKVASGSNYSRIASDGTGAGSVIVATGGSQAHNNMPPYLAVYVWKRTA